MIKELSMALRIEAREYMRNSRTIKAMVDSGELSPSAAATRRTAILLKLSRAMESDGTRTKGRPKIEKLDIGRPTGMLYQTNQFETRRGRPKSELSWWFELVYQTVEEERVRLVEQRKSKGTTTAAIRSILYLRLAPAMGWSSSTAGAKFESLRADYRRGKALARARERPSEAT